MPERDDVPEPYIALWKIAVLIVVCSFGALVGTLALVRTPTYALAALGNPLLYVGFAFFVTIALTGFFYQNRANLP
jgi:hypothetical protein